MDSSRGAVPPRRPGTAPSARPSFALAWRVAAAVGALVSAVIHVVLYVDGYDTIAVVGPLFLVNAVAGVVLAGLLVSWRHWLPLVGGIGFGGLTLLAFVLSTTTGFYGVNESFAGANEILAAASEVVTVVGCALALLREYVR